LNGQWRILGFRTGRTRQLRHALTLPRTSDGGRW
jgi:hypothetical protein